MLLVRNPYYHHVDTANNQLPYVDRLEISLVGDKQLYDLKVSAGEADFVAYYTGAPSLPHLQGRRGAGRLPDHHRAIATHRGAGDVHQSQLPGPGTPEAVELGKAYFAYFADELPMIPTIGLAPHPVIIHNRLKNVPSENIFWGSDTNFYAPYKPEQW